jgi:hypothetical protein
LTCNVLASIIAAVCLERLAKWELMVPAMVLAVSLLETHSLSVVVKAAGFARHTRLGWQSSYPNVRDIDTPFE